MARLVDLPARNGLPPVAMAVRISTPSNKAASDIDRAYSTILLFHPLWTDSFFFYPQYEDPAFNEHFNLVTIETRGHGETVLSALGEGNFDWSDAAEDAALVLRELGVKTVHVVGVSIGGQIGLQLAQKYPLASLTLVNSPSSYEPPGWNVAFGECKDLLLRATVHDDVEALDDITLGYWSLGIGKSVYGSIKELRDRFIEFQRTRLANGQLGLAAPYLSHLLATRKSVSGGPPKRTSLLFLTSNEIQDPVSLAQRLGGKVVSLGDVARWASLTNPSSVNALILEHIAGASRSNPPASPISPLAAAFSRASLSPKRLHSAAPSPSEMSGFDIPAPPIAAPDVLTVGQVLDKEKSSGIPVTVEVHVSISEP